MTISLLYIAAAAASFTIGLVIPWLILSIVFWWASLSLLIVGISYYTDYYRIYRKRSDGRIPTSIKWLLWPVMLGSSVYNLCRRYLDKRPAFHQVADNLYVGSRLFQQDIEVLKEKGIVAILDVTAEFNGLDWRQDDDSLYYLNVPILDHRSPSQEQIQKALNWLHNHLRHQRPVIVHCALGRGRSVFTCAAYLAAQAPDKNIDTILTDIERIRSIARLNKTQRQQLHQLSQQQCLNFGPPAALVVNPVAGGGKWSEYQALIMHQLSQTFQLTLYKTTKEIGTKELTQTAIQQGARYIFAGGGDGTVNEVASELIHSDVALGIIPLGTANALYMALIGEHAALLPIDIACDVLQRQQTHVIDTINCNDALGLLMVGLGFESDMIHGANRSAKDDSGQWAYLRSFWQALNRGDSIALDYKLDDMSKFEQDTASIVVANAAPLSSLLARGGGKPDFKDGQLSITLIPNSDNTAGHIARLFELLMDNLKPYKSENYSNHYTAKKITISRKNESNEPLNYVVDGEKASANSLSIEIQEKSLLILGR